MSKGRLRSRRLWLMQKLGLLCLLLLFCVPLRADIALSAPEVVHLGSDFEVSLDAAIAEREGVELRADGRQVSLAAGAATLVAEKSGSVILEVFAEGELLETVRVRAIPGWLSIAPPLIAIGLALWLRVVIPAVFFGLWSGLFIVYGFSLENFGSSLLDIFAVNIVDELADRDHIALLLFTAMIGGMVGVVSRNGGMRGVVNKVVRWASNPVRGQVSVSLLGLSIFFDNYTNTLVVGTSVRPITRVLV